MARKRSQGRREAQTPTTHTAPPQSPQVTTPPNAFLEKGVGMAPTTDPAGVQGETQHQGEYPDAADVSSRGAMLDPLRATRIHTVQNRYVDSTSDQQADEVKPSVERGLNPLRAARDHGERSRRSADEQRQAAQRRSR